MSKKTPVSHEPKPVLHSCLTLLEVSEPELLEELKMDRKLGPLIVRSLSPCVAVISPGSGNVFVKHLLKAGHTPKIIESAT